MENTKQHSYNIATMDIPAINACAIYSYGYSNVHRQLAKEKAQREGRLDVTEADVEATAIDACRAYCAELEERASQLKNNHSNDSRA